MVGQFLSGWGPPGTAVTVKGAQCLRHRPPSAAAVAVILGSGIERWCTDRRSDEIESINNDSLRDDE